MEVDCRRRFKNLTALQLSSLVELCNTGVRVGITIRVLGGNKRGCISRKWQSQIESMQVISLPGLTDLYLSGKEAATQPVIEWFLRCGMPQLGQLSYIALPWARSLRCAPYAAPGLICKFGDLPMLTSLCLAQNGLARRSIQLLKALTGLTKLDISANPLYPDEMHDLASTLYSLTQLVELDMSLDYLLDNGLAVVAPAIPKSITRLDLSSNQLGIDGGESLAGLILPSLTWLNLSSNALGASMLQLSSLTNLTALDLSNNGLPPS
jgi:Leucine-rich repeat (LRR) protein